MAAGKGGNKGGKKGGNKGAQRRNNRLRTRATNDVQLMNQPNVDTLNAQLQQAQENYLRMQQAGQSASGGAYDAIRGVDQPDFQGLANQFTSNLNQLAPEFGGAGATMPYRDINLYDQRGGEIGMPANEVAAGNALGGAIGQAGLSGFANDASRFGMSQANAEREASVFGRNQSASLMQNMEDTLQQYNNQLHGITAAEPYQIKQRLDELKDQALTQQMAREKMKSDAAFSDWLSGQVGAQLGNQGGGALHGGFHPNGGGHGGGNGHPGGQVDVGYGGYGGGPDTWGGNSGGGNGVDTGPAVTGPAGHEPTPFAQHVMQAADRINGALNFADVPPWMQRLYETYPQGDRWQGLNLQNAGPRRRQVFRRTKGHVQGLYQAQQ